MRLRLGHKDLSTATRLAVASVTAVLLAGCSSDVTRFASNPFEMDQAPTASIPQGAPGPQAGFQPASIGAVDSAPLSSPAPAYGSARPAPVAAQPSPVYNSPAQAAPRVIAAPPQAQAHAPASAPAKAQPQATEKFNFVKGAAPAAATPPAASQAKAPEPQKATAKAVEKPVEKVAAKTAEKPVEKTAAKPAQQAVETPLKQAEKPVAEKPKQMAKLETGAPAAAAPAVAPAATPAAAPQAAAEPDSDKPEFRWPARGRIIQGFKAGSSEGIKIALPEGTAVKAAEAGVVAYAGNELKGYGNLVLIKHPNGFVSVYANNGEISVKRGDTVKRGQLIAKSGQSGNVSSPQLHFELRKGSTPVDPTDFLAGL